MESGSLRLLGMVCVAVVGVSAFALILRLEPRPFADSFEHPSLEANVWQIDAHSECRLSMSGAPVRDGAQSFGIEAPGGRRCELVPRLFPPVVDKFLREPYSKERLYRFSVFVETFDEAQNATDLGENTVVAQWHSSPEPFADQESGRGPPLALRIHNGRWGITFGWDADFLSTRQYIAGNWMWVGPVEGGRWVDWEFRVRWSPRSDGTTEVRRNGELVMQRSGPNTYNDLRGVYLKLGLYHPTVDSKLYLDRVTVTDADHGVW